MLQKGELDDPIGEGTRVFAHRYSGGQVDNGYIDQNGDIYAWHGGDEELVEDVDDLDILWEVRPEDIDMEENEEDEEK